MEQKGSSQGQAYLTHYCQTNAQYVLKSWWILAEILIVKYNKGLIDGKKVGYPKWWLRKVGYAKGPVKY